MRRSALIASAHPYSRRSARQLWPLPSCGRWYRVISKATKSKAKNPRQRADTDSARTIKVSALNDRQAPVESAAVGHLL